MLMAHLTAQGWLVKTNALFSLQHVTAGGRHYKRPTGVLEQHKKPLCRIDHLYELIVFLSVILLNFLFGPRVLKFHYVLDNQWAFSI